uniref:I-set domain-containing protein n=1 Tax=Macrostomum lignano TaxID=282301 RepID=A0A1I8HZ81_9PLAT
HPDRQPLRHLVSTLQISRISIGDSGNYTCKAENNHGSIQKWVYVAVQSVLPTLPFTTTSPAIVDDSACPPLYCLHNGSCSSYPGGIKFCK